MRENRMSGTVPGAPGNRSPYGGDCMNELQTQIEAADRLAIITQKVGYGLWQLQELEGVSATTFVLIAEAEKGMGLTAGEALGKRARKRTFGATIHQLADAGVIDEALDTRFRTMLEERNWLVHRSRGDSRRAVYHDKHLDELLIRLDWIAEEALALLKEVGKLAEAHVKSHGVSEKYIQENAAKLLKEWHAADAI